MTAQSGPNGPETLPSGGRIHVIGAGPVGLLMTALLQSNDRFSVHLFEKRPEYTRTRMVQLAPYLVADSMASYCTDNIDAEGVEAIFEPADLADGIAFRQSLPADLMGLLRGWTQGYCPLNLLERSLNDLIATRGSRPVQRSAVAVTVEDAMSMVHPGDAVIDCTGTKSLLRDHLVPGAAAADGTGNTFRIRLEYSLVMTFLYRGAYDCNEYCKYYKNIENARYKFIPAISRTYYDGNVTHVTGIVNISTEDYERMPSRFDGQWLRDNFPLIAQSMDRFMAKVDTETGGEMVGDLEVIRIPLDVYRARNATSRQLRRGGMADHPFARSPVFLVGDSAIGSPFFQSISLGFDCAMFLARLLEQQDLPLEDLLDRYELYMYKQWLRVYMRSKTIKNNKDLFEWIGDNFVLLDKLHIY
jgi:2-polyprenyl-6-methoxyphenol hydroxylase-like FAD-dependent oxidoreductase